MGDRKMSEAYREKALECLLSADQVCDPDERFRLLHIAQMWIALAHHVMAREHRAAKTGEQLDQRRVAHIRRGSPRRPSDGASAI